MDLHYGAASFHITELVELESAASETVVVQREPTCLLVDTPYIEDEVHVSPEGRWVTFNADESGRWEVYVAASELRLEAASSGGSVQPQWRADGRELSYLGPDGSMMSVRVDARTEFTASPPTRLFATNIMPDPFVPHGVTADGQRFLGLERAEKDQSFTFLINRGGGFSNAALSKSN